MKHDQTWGCLTWSQGCFLAEAKSHSLHSWVHVSLPVFVPFGKGALDIFLQSIWYIYIYVWDFHICSIFLRQNIPITWNMSKYTICIDFFRFRQSWFGFSFRAWHACEEGILVLPRPAPRTVSRLHGWSPFRATSIADWWIFWHHTRSIYAYLWQHQ